MWFPKRRLGTLRQHGVTICWTRDVSAAALEAGLAGLDFLAYHDPRRMNRLRRHCPTVAFASLIVSSEAIFRRPCVLDFVPTASAIDNACQLVHDTTHALLHQRTNHSLSLQDTPWVRYRVERLCLLEESRFLGGVDNVLNEEQRAYATEHREWAEAAVHFERDTAEDRQATKEGEAYEARAPYPGSRPVERESHSRRLPGEVAFRRYRALAS